MARRQNVRLSEACERYMDRALRDGRAESTRYSIKYALERLQRDVDRGRDPWVHLISESDIESHMYSNDGRPRTAISFNQHRMILKTFFTYVVLMGWADFNPMRSVGKARPEAAKPKLYLSATELLKLLDYTSNPVERIACSLGMNTGMRGNDIRRLTIFEANLAAGVIQTEIRKSRKLDSKPITMELHWELSTWFETYTDLMGLSHVRELSDDWLLVPAYRNPAPRERDRRVKLRPYAVHTNPWRLVQRPLEKMGYPTKGEGFHTLRRSSARALFESLRDSDEGRDHALMVVKEYLNHSSVSQTEHYLGLNQERVIRDALLKDRPFLSNLAKAEGKRADLGRAQGLIGGV